MSESSLIKLQAPQNCNFIKKRLQHSLFEIVKFAKFLRAPCVTKHLQWLLLKVFRFPACNFIKKETPAKMFFCEFCKMFENIFSFDRTPPDDCFLCLCVNFEKFFRKFLLQSTSEKLLFHV